MTDVKLTRIKKVLKFDEVVIDKCTLLEPLDLNYKSPYFKVGLFLEILAKTEDSFTYMEDEVKKIDTAKYQVDEDGIIIPDPDEQKKYSLKMKPIHDCEKFISENSFSFWDLLELMRVSNKNSASLAAQKKAFKRLANDIKQSEKLFVFDCWKVWQSKPEQYKYKVTFAKAMIEKFRPDDPDEESKHLCSTAKIVQWCGLWEREKHTQLAK